MTKLPPHDIEGERYILGSIFRDYRKVDEVNGLTADDFFSPAHQDIFAACMALSGRNLAVDIATVSEELKSQGRLTGAGGYAYLVELMRSDFTTLNIGYHAKIVKRYAIRRKVMYVAAEMAKEAANPTDQEAFLDHVEKMVLDIREKHADSETQHISYFTNQTLEAIDARKHAKANGISTGIPALDHQFTLCPNQLIVIGGRPGGGKSISGLQFAVHAASGGTPVVFYSLEMSGRELSDRALSLYGTIDAAYVSCKRPEFDEAEGRRLSDTAHEVSRLPLFVNDKPWNTAQGIIADARRMKRKHNIGMIVVDYLQLVSSVRGSGQLRYEQLGEITQSFKNLAKELKLPVILLAQLNRESEKGGASKEPEIWHLKESGSTEQDADIVLLLWPEMGSDVVNIKIAKNRHGIKDVRVQVRHAKSFMRFESMGVY